MADIYGVPHCLIDRDGRVIDSHLPLPSGPVMAEARSWQRCSEMSLQVNRSMRYERKLWPSFAASTAATLESQARTTSSHGRREKV